MIKRNKKNIIFDSLLFIYFILLPIDASLPKIPILRNIINLLIIILIILVVIQLFNRKKIKIPPKSVVFYYLFFSFSFIFSLSKDITPDTGITFIFYGLFFLLLYMTEYEIKEKQLFYSGIITILVVFYYLFTNFDFSTNSRPYINFGHRMDPNYFASNLVLLTFVYSYFTFKGSSTKIKLISIITLSSIFYIILLTGSRGGMLANIMIFIIMLFANFKTKDILKYSTIIIASSFVVLKYFLPNVPEGILSRLSISSAKATGGSGRLRIWIESIRIYKEGTFFELIFGRGFGTTKYVVSTGHLNHSSWIQSLTEGGIIGLLSWTTLIVTIFISKIKRKNLNKIALLLAMNIVLLTLDFHYTRMFWFLLYILFNSSLFIGTENRKDLVNLQ